MNISTSTAIDILIHPDNLSIKIGRGRNGNFFPKISLSEDKRVLVTLRWASHKTREGAISTIKKILETALLFEPAVNSFYVREFSSRGKFLSQDKIDRIIKKLNKGGCDFVDTSTF